jgi:hypothetical protein
VPRAVVNFENLPQVRTLLVAAVELLHEIEDTPDDEVPAPILQRAEDLRSLISEWSPA